MAEVLNSEFLELTRDEKEAFINRRVEMIRLKNENLKKRHEEIERDKQNAEQLSKLAPHRHSDEVRVSPPKQSAGIGRGRRLAERSKQAKELKSRQHEPKRREYERDRSPQQRDAQPPRHNHRYAPDTDDTGAPPPDPSFNFLADPGRHGGFRKHGGPTRQEGSRRHISNWGGTNFGNVKQNINRMKEREDYKSGRDGPKSKRELELSMTGRERQEYESWKAERDRVDLERLNRHERSGKREWDKEKVAIVDDVADKQKPQQEFQHRRGGPTQHRTGRVGSGRIVIKDGDSPARHRDVETDYGSSGVSQVDTKKDVQQHEVSHSRRRRKDEPHYASRNNDESRRTKARESGAAYPATHFKSVESPTPTGIDRSTPDQRNSDVRHASQVGKEDVWQSPPKGGSTLHAAVGSHWPSKVSMKMSEVVVTPSNASQPAEEVLDEEVDDGEVPQNTDRNIMTEEDQIVICISNNLVGKLTSREQRTAKNRERRLKARAKKASSRSSVSSSSGELEEGRAGDPFDREERNSADEDVQGIQSDKVTKNQPSGKRADQGVECSRKLNGEPLEDDEDQWEDATNTSGSLDLSGRSEEPPCIEATAPQTPTTPQRMKTPEARVPVPDWAAAMESPRSSVGDSPQQYPAVGSDDTAQLYGEIVKADRGEAEANACVEGNPVTVATGLMTDEPAVVSGSEALLAQMPLGDSLKTGTPGANILETETAIAEVMENCTPKSDAPETRMPQGNVLESGTPKGDVLEIEIHEGDDAETMASEGDAAETGVPECDVSETGAPECDAAETVAPEGDVAESVAPECDVAETGAPECDAAETGAAESNAGETGAPEGDVAETGAPECDAAETGAPEGDAAEIGAPESDSAETGAPEGDASEIMASEGDFAETGAPESDAAETGAPESDAAETGAPESDAAETEAPESDAAEIGAPEGDAAEIMASEGDGAETGAPGGDAAETGAPECDSAETGAPGGDAAENGAPESDAAETGAPEGDVAEIGAPAYDAAETGAPEGDAAEIMASEGDGAETGAPDGDVAESGAPESDAAETMASKGDAAETGAPEGDAAETGAPESDAAETGAPESDAAETMASKGDAAETMASEGDVQQAGRPEGDVLKTDTPEFEILETGSPTPLTCQSSGSGMSNATAIPTVCEGDSAPVQRASVPDVLPDAENYIAEAEVAGAQSEVDQHSRQTESAEA